MSFVHLVHFRPPEHLVLMTRHRSQACDVRDRGDGEGKPGGPDGGRGGRALLRILCWAPRPRVGENAADIVSWLQFLARSTSERWGEKRMPSVKSVGEHEAKDAVCAQEDSLSA